MPAKTCAACDAPLDSNAISVTVGGKTVEVCCDECGEKLKDGHFSSKALTPEVDGIPETWWN